MSTTREDFRIQPCLSPVWDTAINVIALAESGVPPEHESLQRAAQWLESKEVTGTRGDWQRRTRIAEKSGWAFEFNNVYYPDTDDTMMVLMALRLVPTVASGVAEKGDLAAPRAMFERALRWLLTFQCSDGGWAAFDKDVMQRWLEDVPFADHNAILDPTCSDLTGRVLELLGYIGYDQRVQPRPARHALHPRDAGERRLVVRPLGRQLHLRHLAGPPRPARHRRSTCASRGSSGRATGWRAARTKTAAGAKRARATTTRRSRASARAPRARRRGRSWASSPPRTPRSRRRSSATPSSAALRYLIGTQAADGSWPEPQTTGTGFPSVFYLRYDMYRNNWPLLALATYRNYVDGTFHQASWYQCEV